MDEERVNIDAVAALVHHLDETRAEGAILVFMPGMAEIQALVAALSAGNPRERTLLPLPLHSTIASSDQLAVFNRPPRGLRKVVVATNIAETSITIDDILFVIDSGRAKENRYDALNRLPQLVDCWIATANRRQRRGRAGRVRPGEAFYMYTRERSRGLTPFQPAEMLRVPLHELCLQIKLLGLGEIVPFLSRAIEPPALHAVQEAVQTLNELQALEGPSELLTPLGHHLATLPVDVRIGKMLIFGCMLRCLHPVLTIAAALSLRSPFLDPFDKRDEARAARRRFAAETRSDHLALLRVYEAYRKAVARGSGAAREFCRTHFLSAEALGSMEQVMGQFVELLVDIGFLQTHLALPTPPATTPEGITDAPTALEDGGLAARGNSDGSKDGIASNGGKGGVKGGGRGGKGKGGGKGGGAEAGPSAMKGVRALLRHRPIGGEYYNVHSGSMACLRAVLCAGLYPNVVRASSRDEEELGGKGKGGSKGKGGGKGGGRRARTPLLEGFGGSPVELHPSSANADTAHFESRWLVYYEKVRTAKVYLRDSSMVTPYPLLLFGGELKVRHAEQTITVDKWIEFDAAPRVAVLFRQLRAELDKLLLQKLATPTLELSKAGRTIDAIVSLLEEEQGVHQAQDAYAKRL